MQHGVKRQIYDAELRRRKLEKDKFKIKTYRELVSELFEKKNAKDFSEESFELTLEIILLNPDFYSVWNYRKDILLSKVAQSQNSQEFWSKELAFTIVHLKLKPKTYCIWNHRKWCLQNNLTNVELFKSELKLAEKILTVDSRNFHGWAYRRYLISMIEEISDLDLLISEFQYTSKMISINFSNYSALHNRTNLIVKIFNGKDKLFTEDTDSEIKTLFSSKLHFLNKELAYFQNAIYTDPEDQAVWLYLNWLFTSDFFIKDIPRGDLVALLLKNISDIEELNTLEKEDNNGIDNNWCLKIKSSIELVLINKFGISTILGKDINNDLSQSIVALKRSDPKRINRYKYLQKTLISKNC